MNSFKRQVSPGAAAFLVVLVLAIVQWIWYRGLIYKPGPKGGPSQTSNARSGPRPDLVLIGRKYVDVHTLAGAPDPGYVDGPGYIARFDRPTGLALDRAGILYVCDTGNHKIRAVAPNGSVTTLAGSDQGFADGPSAQAKFNTPCGICVSPDGAIYVADTGNGRVRRIRDGQVTTIIQEKPSNTINSATSPLPVAIEYRDKPTPGLFVLDAASRLLNQYSLDGTYRSGVTQLDTAIIRTPPPAPISGSVTTTSVPAADSAVTSSDSRAPNGKRAPAVMQIVGTEELADVARRPTVRHLTGWCRIGSAALATDLSHGAIFYVRNGSADVLAGIVNAEFASRDWRDGNGETALFCYSTGVVTDNVKYAYVADTGNNCIRRLTLPSFLFK